MEGNVETVNKTILTSSDWTKIQNLTPEEARTYAYDFDVVAEHGTTLYKKGYVHGCKATIAIGLVGTMLLGVSGLAAIGLKKLVNDYNNRKIK